MIQSDRGSTMFEREARRCERLCLAVYDPALQSQLLRIASDYRARAARMRDERAA